MIESINFGFLSPKMESGNEFHLIFGKEVFK